MFATPPRMLDGRTLVAAGGAARSTARASGAWYGHFSQLIHAHETPVSVVHSDHHRAVGESCRELRSAEHSNQP